MTIGQTSISFVLSIWLTLLAATARGDGERWSRQVSNSEWIPLTNPRGQQTHPEGLGQNIEHLVPPNLAQIHQPLIPGSLPPELRQEYQQQLIQLQKTQESIQKLLLLQQQLKSQQQLLQGQAFLPNTGSESEENKQALHQSSIANVQTLPELAPEVLVPPQPSGEPRPPVFPSQNFRDSSSEQERYREYNDRRNENYGNAENVRDKDKYVPEAQAGSGNAQTNGGEGEEEIQVVYVPAETLAQRGHKNQNRGRDRKQYGGSQGGPRHHHRESQQQQQQQQEAYNQQRGSVESGSRETGVAPSPPTQDDTYTREFLEQLQREHEGTDRLLKEARQKELERLREERKEIQRQAKLQQAALEREQEMQRQREAEKKRKELAKLEELAKQRELERIRASRERQRLEEAERTRKAQARANEEKRKREEARQAEIERLAALERQKKAEIERTIAAQKELERVQKEDEERARARATERTFTGQKETSRVRYSDSDEIPQAQPLIRNDNLYHQQSTATGQSSGKYNRHGRVRNKGRQRYHGSANHGAENERVRSEEETTTTIPAAAPSPNQPPLAVYMNTYGIEKRIVGVTDVLKTLKNAKSIDVLDNVGQDAPQVFVGPSSLEVPTGYAKFDLPYLSAIDNNRVERRVDKLPFFVAPLSFNPPPGYSKIPFPAPHIGSVVVNTLDSNISPTQSAESHEEEIGKANPNPNPLIEPNAFLDGSTDQGFSYSTTYDSPTTPNYSNYREEVPTSTALYQPGSSLHSSGEEGTGPGRGYRFRQSYNSGERGSSSSSQERPTVQTHPEYPDQQSPSRPSYHEQSQLRPNFPDQSQTLHPAFHEESQSAPDHPSPQQSPQRYPDESVGSTTPSYRRPNTVTAFAYQESPHVLSSTPVYQESYSQVRGGPSNSRLSSPNHDSSQHRDLANRYQLTDQEETNERGREYANADSGIGASYEDPARGPTHYNLPAELPPILPQLPGLVNSLLEEADQEHLVNRQSSTTGGTPIVTTTIPTTTTTTTTEAPPTTTQRTRGRHRGRLVATRPSTTTTTTTSSPATSKSRDNERPRRPFGRSRSRYTTTTEEYRETYEPTRSKISETTQRYNAHESYRRPAKTNKYKNHENDSSHQSRNHLHNVQAHEALESERNQPLETNSRTPIGGSETNDQVYDRYNFGSTGTNLENYPTADIPENDGLRASNPGEDVDYTKTLNYPETRPSDATVSEQYQESFPTADFTQSRLEESPVNGFNYQTRNDQSKSTPGVVPPTAQDYAYYRNKQDNLEGGAAGQRFVADVPTEATINSQLDDYQRQPGAYENVDNTRGRVANDDQARIQQSHFPQEGPIYDPYADRLAETGLLPEQQVPLEEATTPPTTTTTTTTESAPESAPVVIRQRVRGRLGARGRTDSLIQTKPRGSQDEYVRFSAVNNQNESPSERAERPATVRQREKTRSRVAKTRPQYQGVQVQTEGNDYVRIQAPVRSYQKTIVTPPSNAQRTSTTTQAPITTTVDYQLPNDELDYGFIRAPNFNPVHPVENRYQNSYRHGDNQAQLQSVLPTDETAEDSSPSHAQVSRNRPKYQSPNRRPSIKPSSSGTTATATTTTSTTSTSLATESASYTEKPRTRVDEPKNNKIRVRGRKPGRRRTTTTTTTTTREYIIEENNDLPLEENYPRPIENVQDTVSERQTFYDDKFESLPLNVGSAKNNPAQQQYPTDNSYTNPEFLVNFDPELVNPEVDQTQLASHPPARKYGHAASLTRAQRVGPSSGKRNPDRDIYGAESQWSTKLTSASFQPSSGGKNYVTHDRKAVGNPKDDAKNKYSNDETSADEPEIITAPPDDVFVTVVASNSPHRETKHLSKDKEVETSEASSIAGTNYGMKTSPAVRTTTPATEIDATTTTPASDAATSFSDSSVKTDSRSGSDAPPTRRTGARRRRVRVRVRPAPIDDFVTAESQHFSSAFNSLIHENAKYNRYNELWKETTATTVSPINREEPKTELEEIASIPVKTFLDDFLHDILKTDNKTEGNNETADATQRNVETTTDGVAETTVNLETTTENYVQDSKISGETEREEISTETPIMTTMTLPRKSWDSASNNVEFLAMQSGGYLRNFHGTSENVDFDDKTKTTNVDQLPNDSELDEKSKVSKFDEEKTTESNSGLNESANNLESNEKPTMREVNEVLENDFEVKSTTKNNEKNGMESDEVGNYPKNHRSEWSEVSYPNDKNNFFLYNRNFPTNVTSTELPAVDNTSQNDASVKTLSDYVKAIFDTMKSVDEEKNDDTNPTELPQNLSSNANSSDSNQRNFQSPDILVNFSATNDDKIVDSAEKLLISENEATETSVKLENNGNSEKLDNSVNPEKFESSENPIKLTNSENSKETEKNPGGTTEISEEENSFSTSNTPMDSEAQETFSTAGSIVAIPKGSTETGQMLISAEEIFPNPIKANQTKLGAILRTSTTTKVSHMTEICYRGRCVMTKPKNEINAR